MRPAKLSVVLGTSLVLLATAAVAAARSELERIDAVLKTIEQSKITFIRNGGEHDGKAAAKHLRSKLKSAGDRVKTFEQFVDGLATRSSFSGKPYQVRLEDGSVVPLAPWLRKTDAAAAAR